MYVCMHACHVCTNTVMLSDFSVVCVLHERSTVIILSDLHSHTHYIPIDINFKLTFFGLSFSKGDGWTASQQVSLKPSFKTALHIIVKFEKVLRYVFVHETTDFGCSKPKKFFMLDKYADAAVQLFTLPRAGQKDYKICNILACITNS